MVAPNRSALALSHSHTRTRTFAGTFYLAIRVVSAYYSGMDGDICIPITVVGQSQDPLPTSDPEAESLSEEDD